MDTQLGLLSEKWNGILQTIRQDNGLSDVAFKTWLLPLKIFRIENNILKIKYCRHLLPSHQVGNPALEGAVAGNQTKPQDC